MRLGAGGVDFTIGSKVGLRHVKSEPGKVRTLRMHFLPQGHLTTEFEFDFGEPQHTVQLEVDVELTEGELAKLLDKKHARNMVIHPLILAKGNWGIWNLVKRKPEINTISCSKLEKLGMTCAGVVCSATDIKVGQFGILANKDHVLRGDDEVLFVAKTPEPATAALSLLGLVALCARRRR